MPYNYSCCRNKELNNYCCIICHNIYHKSCMERKKEAVIIEKHKIYCGKKCAEKDESDDIKTLKELIDELQKEIIEKDAYINKQKRNHVVFEQDAMEIEEQYKNEIDKYRSTVGHLQQIINKEVEKNSEISKRNEEAKSNAHATKLELENLIFQNKEFKNKLIALQNEYDITVQKLEFLQLEKLKEGEIKQTESRGFQTTEKLEKQLHPSTDNINSAMKTQIKLKNSEIETENYNFGNTENDNIGDPAKKSESHSTSQFNNSKKNRVLLLTDGRGKQLNTLIRKKTNNEYDILTFIKSGALMNRVIENIEHLAKDLTHLDHLVIMAGSNDLLQGQMPSFKLICNKLKLCSHTNISFISVPYVKNDCFKNNYIYKYNDKLNNFLYRFNKFAEGQISYIEINDIQSVKLSEDKVANSIINKLIYKRHLPKNLKFINITRELDTTFATSKIPEPTYIDLTSNRLPIERETESQTSENFLYPRLSEISFVK